jgi:hypothetical protein
MGEQGCRVGEPAGTGWGRRRADVSPTRKGGVLNEVDIKFSTMISLGLSGCRIPKMRFPRGAEGPVHQLPLELPGSCSAPRPASCRSWMWPKRTIAYCLLPPIRSQGKLGAVRGCERRIDSFSFIFSSDFTSRVFSRPPVSSASLKLVFFLSKQ